MKNYVPEMKYETVTIQSSVTKRVMPPGFQLEIVAYDEEEFFKRTEIGRRYWELVAIHDVYHDKPMHQNVLRYWAELGLKKELFDADHDNAKYSYSVFTPLDLDPEKKYAVIYFSHGGGNTIQMAETYGFNTLAAVEKYIIVYAENGGRSNDQVIPEFARIMGELREKGYPVDWERVYSVGFSSGGMACSCTACTYTDRIAAVAVLPGANFLKEFPFYTGPEYYASTKGYRMPAIFLSGDNDHGNFPAPWVAKHPEELYKPGYNGVPKMEYAIENLNIWMRDIAKIKNYTPLTVESVSDLLLHSTDPVELEYGLKFDRGYAFRAQGTDWLGGDYYGTDGAPVIRYARAAGMIHITWESEANLVWDYLKHFRRDLKTGESLYDPVVCWGER